MYTMDWLRERVRFHLNPAKSKAQVFLAVTDTKVIIGHFIVRIDGDESGKSIGFGSTIYVAPEFRRQRVAQKLLHRGEQWFKEQGLSESMYLTASGNEKLIRLFTSEGYKLVGQSNQMVKLWKQLG